MGCEGGSSVGEREVRGEWEVVVVCALRGRQQHAQVLYTAYVRVQVCTHAAVRRAVVERATNRQRPTLIIRVMNATPGPPENLPPVT